MELKVQYQKTEAGLIPEEWTLKAIGAISTPSKTRILPSNSPNYRCIELEHLSSESGRLFGYADSRELKSQKTVFKSNDTLFGKLRPYLKKYFFADFDGVCTTEIWALRPSSEIEPKLLYYLVQSERFVNAANQSTGTKMPRAEWKTVSELAVCLPTARKEQIAIVTALSDADALIANLEKLIAKKRLIKQGLIQTLLEPKKEWEIKTLRDCLQRKPDYGINASAVRYRESLPTYLRITDISDDGRFLKETKVSVENEQASDYYLHNGDLVFARTGASVGKTYLYKPEDGKLVFAGFLIRIKLSPDLLLPDYFFFFTQTRRYWNWVQMNSMRTGQPGINSNQYEQLELHVPPLNEQKVIVETIWSIEKEIHVLEIKYNKFQMIKRGMMQTLLTGKIRLI